MLTLDLFCGAGGASEGMAQLSLNPIGFDRWPVACASHQVNGHRTVCADGEIVPSPPSPPAEAGTGRPELPPAGAAAHRHGGA